jgi:hypothetical protein
MEQETVSLRNSGSLSKLSISVLMRPLMVPSLCMQTYDIVFPIPPNPIRQMRRNAHKKLIRNSVNIRMRIIPPDASIITRRRPSLRLNT